MRRSTVIPLAIFLLAVVGALAAVRIYWPSESNRYSSTKAVLHTKSEIRMTFAIVHEKGPIAREQITYTNVDGNAKAAYEGTNRTGSAIARFSATVDGYEVANLFGQAVQDGIWELQSKPPRGDTQEPGTGVT